MVAQRTDLGEEGVELARLYDYDAVLLDMHLPDMSGIEVVRRLRSAGVDTPVVMLSGEADVLSKVKALKVGADDYIT
jgi:two-component system cell cycle response regulator CtrA